MSPEPLVHHISYATRRFSGAAWLLARSARQFGIESTRTYRPDDPLIVDLASRFPDIMSAERGAGYWLWKPFIIRDTLARARDGDLVLYTDAAAIFVSDPGPLFELTGICPVVLFSLGSFLPMRSWTKRDCFVGLGADTPEYWDMPQLMSGIQLYRAGRQARDFIDQTCAAMVVPNVLTDAPNVLGRPNFPEFREHRHDQSVLSIIARKNNIPSFPGPLGEGPSELHPGQSSCGGESGLPRSRYGQIVEFHRRKGRSFYRWYLRRLFSPRK